MTSNQDVANLATTANNSTIAISCDSGLRRNNFDLLRFLFAFVVFLVHAYALSGAATLAVLEEFLSSDIAVKSFFVVSGFLIFMSYENSRNIYSYFKKRVRRIYPAYVFIVLACTILGSLVSNYGLGEYFSLHIVKYISANLVFLNFLQPELPGLFEKNRFQAVNGALWTLKIEVMFYLFVPIAVFAFRKFGRLSVLIVLYVCSVIYSMNMLAMANKTGGGIYFELQRQLPGQIAFFISGAAGYYYLQNFRKYATLIMIGAVAAFVFQARLPWIALQPLALAVLVVYFACIVPCLGDFAKYGDLSYGIYIVHFPILQLLIAGGLFKESPWRDLLLAGAMILTTAFLLWHFIEKRFLQKSSHYLTV
jgi:peptidoglycan/LPS O-acetylase OafA/YrhL